MCVGGGGVQHLLSAFVSLAGDLERFFALNVCACTREGKSEGERERERGREREGEMERARERAERDEQRELTRK